MTATLFVARSAKHLSALQIARLASQADFAQRSQGPSGPAVTQSEIQLK
jgi:hypothetical protein